MDLAGKTVAITGIGGFIGLRLAARAAQAGLIVRGLELFEGGAAKARAVGATVVVGDMNDRAAAAEAVRGADFVVHTAATVAAGGELAEFRRVNVEGTRTVADAARNAGAARFVHLSSVMVYGFDFAPNVAEDGPLRGEGNPYCITKIESEKVALDFDDAGGGGGMRVIALRPGDVYGRGSRAWITAPLEFMKKGQFVLPNGGRGILNHVHVDNLVDAIFASLENGGSAFGQSINVTDGDTTTCLAFYERLAKMIGITKVPTAPGALLTFGLGIAERLHLVLKGERIALVDTVRFLGRPHAYSIDKARRVLGYSPRVSLDAGLADVAAWVASGGDGAFTPATSSFKSETSVGLSP